MDEYLEEPMSEEEIKESLDTLERNSRKMADNIYRKVILKKKDENNAR